MTKTEPQTALKPCPHCGSINLRGPHCTEYQGDTYAPTWWVECEECPAGMEVAGQTPEPLIAAWNRRPILLHP
jgi:hypothetical protein